MIGLGQKKGPASVNLLVVMTESRAGPLERPFGFSVYPVQLHFQYIDRTPLLQDPPSVPNPSLTRSGKGRPDVATKRSRAPLPVRFEGLNGAEKRQLFLIMEVKWWTKGLMNGRGIISAY